ncbi:hypothetical protein GCM10022255_110720 [Dactylosporangium darangshiense]|uniref:Uncharacterized protein n=1 Tax=Dactylosporangium darangshiense TaxID=579108 RepID=A0ABP8DUL2_9ACTN
MFTPDPVDEGRLGGHSTGFERECDQQPTQPRARHIGEGAIVGANLERSEHPDLHSADLAMGDGWARMAMTGPGEWQDMMPLVRAERAHAAARRAELAGGGPATAADGSQGDRVSAR